MITKRKNILISTLSTLLLLLAPVTAYAHVIVTPGQAGVGQELVFNVSVPNERESAVTGVKLIIPSGVSDVIPTTKDGWTITATKSSSDDPEVTTLSWTGSIPVGQRQDFSFSAQVPGKATELDWKAYQTYADGVIVHWDQKPAGSDDASGNAGPYSVTQVINDLSSSSATKNTSSSPTGAYVIAGLALLLGIIALTRKRK